MLKSLVKLCDIIKKEIPCDNIVVYSYQADKNILAVEYSDSLNENQYCEYNVSLSSDKQDSIVAASFLSASPLIVQTNELDHTQKHSVCKIQNVISYPVSFYESDYVKTQTIGVIQAYRSSHPFNSKDINSFIKLEIEASRVIGRSAKLYNSSINLDGYIGEFSESVACASSNIVFSLQTIKTAINDKKFLNSLHSKKIIMPLIEELIDVQHEILNNRLKSEELMTIFLEKCERYHLVWQELKSFLAEELKEKLDDLLLSFSQYKILAEELIGIFQQKRPTEENHPLNLRAKEIASKSQKLKLEANNLISNFKDEVEKSYLDSEVGEIYIKLSGNVVEGFNFLTKRLLALRYFAYETSRDAINKAIKEKLLDEETLSEIYYKKDVITLSSLLYQNGDESSKEIAKLAESIFRIRNFVHQTFNEIEQVRFNSEIAMKSVAKLCSGIVPDKSMLLFIDEIDNDVANEIFTCQKLVSQLKGLFRVRRAYYHPYEIKEVCVLVERIVKSFAQFKDSRNMVHSIDINCELNLNESSEDLVIYTDKYLIAEAVQTLMTNACEELASVKGMNPKTVNVSFIKKEGLISVRIKDNGKGISPEIQNRLFERFATYGKQNGTGIGLNAVQGIMDAMQGEINFNPNYGVENHGAEFELIFPILDKRI